MVSSSSINVGIAGLGWPGERHAEAINASSLGTVCSACDLNAERLNAFRSQAEQTVPSEEALIASA
jgi:predicted dehydrogenase